MNNPFIINNYESKDLFCDREEELQLILRNCLNRANMTLISQRRLGKTGLIFRLFDEIKGAYPSIYVVYVDILASDNMDGFINLFAEAVLSAVPEKLHLASGC